MGYNMCKNYWKGCILEDQHTMLLILIWEGLRFLFLHTAMSKMILRTRRQTYHSGYITSIIATWMNKTLRSSPAQISRSVVFDSNACSKKFCILNRQSCTLHFDATYG